MDRRVTPRKRVTSATWGYPPPCKQALRYVNGELKPLAKGERGLHSWMNNYFCLLRFKFEFSEGSLYTGSIPSPWSTTALDENFFFQVLEENMKQENNNFILVKETFEESESMNVMTVESRVKLRRKVDDLKDRWQEMWRSHEVNKQR